MKMYVFQTANVLIYLNVCKCRSGYANGRGYVEVYKYIRVVEFEYGNECRILPSETGDTRRAESWTKNEKLLEESRYISDDKVEAICKLAEMCMRKARVLAISKNWRICMCRLALWVPSKKSHRDSCMRSHSFFWLEHSVHNQIQIVKRRQIA